MMRVFVDCHVHFKPSSILLDTFFLANKYRAEWNIQNNVKGAQRKFILFLGFKIFFSFFFFFFFFFFCGGVCPILFKREVLIFLILHKIFYSFHITTLYRKSLSHLKTSSTSFSNWDGNQQTKISSLWWQNLAYQISEVSRRE